LKVDATGPAVCAPGRLSDFFNVWPLGCDVTASRHANRCGFHQVKYNRCLICRLMRWLALQHDFVCLQKVLLNTSKQTVCNLAQKPYPSSYIGPLPRSLHEQLDRFAENI
jgi:hypothetical protein